MKIINRVLDNYYSDKLSEAIESAITGHFMIDVKAIKGKEDITIYAKPCHYETYTYILSFRKEDAFSRMYDFKNGDFKEKLIEHIKAIKTEDNWNKHKDYFRRK